MGLALQKEVLQPFFFWNLKLNCYLTTNASYDPKLQTDAEIALLKGLSFRKHRLGWRPSSVSRPARVEPGEWLRMAEKNCLRKKW